MFTSVSSALQYLKNILYQWTGVKEQLNNRLIDIGRTIGQQRKNGDQQALGQLIVLKTQTQQRLREYEEFAQKLGPFREYFESNSVGVFPFFVVAGAVGLASALYIYMEKVKNEGNALDMIKQGLLSPSEAKSLLTGGGLSETLGNVNTMLMLGVGVYLLFLVVPMIRR